MTSTTDTRMTQEETINSFGSYQFGWSDPEDRKSVV